MADPGRWTAAEITAAIRRLGRPARTWDIMYSHMDGGGSLGTYRDARRTALFIRELVKAQIVERVHIEGQELYWPTGRRKRVLVSSKRR